MTEVIQGLTDLRDALVHLSLALHDYQFALYAHEDDAAALLKDQILEQARLHEPRLAVQDVRSAISPPVRRSGMPPPSTPG